MGKSPLVFVKHHLDAPAAPGQLTGVAAQQKYKKLYQIQASKRAEVVVFTRSFTGRGVLSRPAHNHLFTVSF